ncbi:hypothetical protein LCGC14_1424710 [marine sediment metagenome]|uniref:Uncharacterized protein n=1 Tax=marine sediment metagenome TaxID=412755 RepID=A0A0F9M5T5_9ZZZZ
MIASLRERRWRRPSGLGWPKWRGWRVVMDNLLIPSGALLPRWYGVAWREPDMDGVVVMPIPLNVLAGWVRRVWHWLRYGLRPSVFDRAVIKAYRRGYTEGSNHRLAEFKRAESRRLTTTIQDIRRIE